MKILIMGCGRVGAQLATLLSNDGHSVTVLDINPDSFRRLPPDFNGVALLGNGIDEEAMKKAGLDPAKHTFNVPRVLCRIYDPLRRDIYESLGLEAISPTTVFARLLKEKIES